jgi:hypothetical protein
MHSLRVLARLIPLYWRLALLLIALSLTLACGSGSTPPKVVSALAPAITAQPTNQSTRVGQSATFSVTAGGTTPLTYQWTKNGAVISGATAASYTTGSAAPTDNGAIFGVTVSNAIGSATSTPATLSVGPRAPKSGDWRFQGIDLVSVSTSFALSDLNELSGVSYPNSVGTPLEIGVAPGTCYTGVAYDCAWRYVVLPPPQGVTSLSAYYQSDLFTNLDTDINALTAPNILVTSLDFESSNQLFAASWLQLSGSSGFSLQTQWVEPSQLQAVASQLGEQSQVITAVSFNAGEAYLLSYGWQNDTTTVYDVSVVTATAENFWTEVTGLAQSGYIITAMGGDPTDGISLVGTRVHGDSMPRPLVYYTTAGTFGQVPSNVFSLSRLIFMSDGGDSFNEQ